MGVLAADDNLVLMAVLLAVGALVLGLFFVHIRARERKDEEPLLSTGLFRNRTSNLGLVTQNVQWLLLMGTAFVVSAYLQVVRGYNAIQTGVIFTAATGGILLSSLAAERLAKRHAQRTLIIAGFVTTIAGVVVLLALVKGSPSAWAFAPGLLLIGLGVGVMLTPSVNVVQSAFTEDLQGEISGLSRCISNLGSSPGHGGRRDHPRVQPRKEFVCRRDDRPGTHRAHRARRGNAPPRPTSAERITAMNEQDAKHDIAEVTVRYATGIDRRDGRCSEPVSPKTCAPSTAMSVHGKASTRSPSS